MNILLSFEAELPKYTDQASVQSSDTYETEEYKPYNEIPMSFTEAVPEKQFNKEWEEYFLKNPSAMKPVIKHFFIRFGSNISQASHPFQR